MERPTHLRHTGYDQHRQPGATATVLPGGSDTSTLVGAGDGNGREKCVCHWLVIILVIVAGLLAAPRTVGAEPTTDQLRDAALTPGDLGPEFGIRAEGSARQGGGWSQIMTRTRPNLVVVTITLQVWADDDLRHAADAYLSGLRSGQGSTGFETREPTTPADFPEGSLAYVFTGSINGQAMVGSIIVWRAGEVVALVGTLTDRGNEDAAAAAVLEYAKQQRVKLANALA